MPSKPAGSPALYHLSPAEAKLRHLIGRNFVETDPPPGNVFSLGEFERNTGVLIAYPGHFGIPTTLIREMARDAIVTTLVAGITQENAVRNIFTSAGVNLDNCQFIYAPTNSYWTRDYGPWYIACKDNQMSFNRLYNDAHRTMKFLLYWPTLLIWSILG
ncbi:hypothetical protein MASR1M74_14230 [Lentimicrobium sp.]